MTAGTERAFAVAPVFHGQLTVRAGSETLDLDTGNASFSIKHWDLLPTKDSNGIDPATEPVIVAVGDGDRFVIPAGQIRASRNGKRFTYTRHTDRGVNLLRLTRNADGTWRVRFGLAGVGLSQLVIADPPVCLPFAIIIGDDDGFSGVSFDRPKPFPSRRLTIPGFCNPAAGWPWL